MIAFEGTHPMFRQVPPGTSRSISATRTPRAAAAVAALSPAGPAPTIARSYRGCKSCLLQPTAAEPGAPQPGRDEAAVAHQAPDHPGAVVLDHQHHDSLIESIVAARYPGSRACVGKSRIEAAGKLLAGQHLRIARNHVAYRGKDDLGSKRQRRQHPGTGQRTVIRPVGHPARGVAEPVERFAAHRGHLVVARTVTGGEAPAILVVPGESQRVTLCVLALDADRVPAVLEVVGALLAHETI